MGYILGLTGNIGSGKSTLADLLISLEPLHARYELGELVAETAEDFNRALSGELAFETTTDDVELVNQALIWFVESISEKLHQEVAWNQLAISKHHLVTHPELFEKMFIYVDAAKKEPRLLDRRITAENKEAYRTLLQWLGGYLVARISNTIWYDELFRRINLHDADKNLVVIGGVRYPSDATYVREHDGLVIGVERPDLEADTTDVTERSRSDIRPDVLVINNGTVDELQKLAEQLWFDLGAGKLQQNYNAHP
jgi:ABC-type dipeptide/oligopeptide/nickel transport system ATPase component